MIDEEEALKRIKEYGLSHWSILKVSHRKKRSKNHPNRNFYFVAECNNCYEQVIRSGPELKNDQVCKSCKYKPRGASGLANLYKRYSAQAKVRSLDIKLTEDDFREITSQRCFYCGVAPYAMSKSANEWGDYVYNGVDRKDNGIGYSNDNCVPCCMICNWAKGKMLLSDYMQYINRLVEYQCGLRNA